MGDGFLPSEMPTTEKACRCRVCGGTWFKGWKYRPAVKRFALFGYVFRTAQPERLETTCVKCGYVASNRPGTTEPGPTRFESLFGDLNA